MIFNKKRLLYFFFIALISFGYFFGSWRFVEPPQFTTEEWGQLFGKK